MAEMEWVLDKAAADCGRRWTLEWCPAVARVVLLAVIIGDEGGVVPECAIRGPGWGAALGCESDKVLSCSDTCSGWDSTGGGGYALLVGDSLRCHM